jgi:hypothetical protein
MNFVDAPGSLTNEVLSSTRELPDFRIFGCRPNHTTNTIGMFAVLQTLTIVFTKDVGIAAICLFVAGFFGLHENNFLAAVVLKFFEQPVVIVPPTKIALVR